MTLVIQLLLAVVITTLTFLISIAAIQVFHILHEFRLTLRKVNHILDNTQTLSDSVTRPVSAVNNFFSEVKTLINTTQDEIIDSTSDKVIQTPKLNDKSPHHFFRRSGLPLRSS
ncbi:hypothetical protein A2397_02555 [Candidatus Amesbacteria bacterium RIFOXYB1_FULL_44_23]|uniref:Uncharacterized protein n=1 Tax=Candidatus Amesbacteria bacterium RIFOXYB1_FULL_44_23 TaxID=1797263 RepID=A0A1F4ZV67_9BACT|nr:MAG: hypothetical protein A2397_02555 [Candidatus Amesbacteria bacterium RIFOXYB1_FULL_44_23]